MSPSCASLRQTPAIYPEIPDPYLPDIYHEKALHASMPEAPLHPGSPTPVLPVDWQTEYDYNLCYQIPAHQMEFFPMPSYLCASPCRTPSCPSDLFLYQIVSLLRKKHHLLLVSTSDSYSDCSDFINVNFIDFIVFPTPLHVKKSPAPFP